MVDFAKRICTQELKEREAEETVNTLWEATDVLLKRNELMEQELYIDPFNNRILIYLPSLLGKIRGSQYTRHYSLPNKREITKLLKTEKYIAGYESVRVKGKVAWRWVIRLDSKDLPDILKDIAELDSDRGEGKKGEPEASDSVGGEETVI